VVAQLQARRRQGAVTRHTPVVGVASELSVRNDRFEIDSPAGSCAEVLSAWSPATRLITAGAVVLLLSSWVGRALEDTSGSAPIRASRSGSFASSHTFPASRGQDDVYAGAGPGGCRDCEPGQEPGLGVPSDGEIYVYDTATGPWSEGSRATKVRMGCGPAAAGLTVCRHTGNMR